MTAKKKVRFIVSVEQHFGVKPGYADYTDIPHQKFICFSVRSTVCPVDWSSAELNRGLCNLRVVVVMGQV
jgi:hypothetical protein